MKRISQLDGLRGLAIIMVLIWHYGVCQLRDASLAADYLCLPFGLTWSGVDLFFVLSGFLIVGILVDHCEAENYFRIFYLRRACRIWPLYFLVLGVCACLSVSALAASKSFWWLFAPRLPVWSYATFTQNFFMSHTLGGYWLGVTWSLAIEEQFYLVIPLLVRFLPRPWLWRVFLAGALFAPVLRLAVGTGTLQNFVCAPCRADSLLAGACLAVLVRSPEFLTAANQNRRKLFGALFALGVGAVVLTVISPQPISSITRFWLAALYCVLVLVALLESERRIGWLLKRPILIWFGRLSFGIYLIHQAVCGLIYGFFTGHAPAIRTLSGLCLTVLALSITLLLASLSYRFIEAPILRFGHRYQYTEREVPVEAELAPV